MALTNEDLRAIEGIVRKHVDGSVDVLAAIISKTVTTPLQDLASDVEDIKRHISTIEESFAMPVHLKFQSRKRPLRRTA